MSPIRPREAECRAASETGKPLANKSEVMGVRSAEKNLDAVRRSLHLTSTLSVAL